MHRPPLTPRDRRRLWRERWMPWQRLAALVVTVAAGALSVPALSTEWSVTNDKAVADARVVNVVDYRRQPDTITVEFTTAAGFQVQADIEDDGPEAGDMVKVEYDQTDPSKARLAGSQGQLLAGLLYGAIALAGIVGLFFPRLGLVVKRRR